MSDNNPTFNVPNRVFNKKEGRKMISMRLPESMVKELKIIAEQRGWTVTDVVQTALEQFIDFTHSEERNNQKEAA